MGKRTTAKECYRYTCEKDFHYLGIARHRKAHLERGEVCEIGYTNGEIYEHKPKETK
jgi:hypothetical protein